MSCAEHDQVLKAAYVLLGFRVPENRPQLRGQPRYLFLNLFPCVNAIETI